MKTNAIVPLKVIVLFFALALIGFDASDRRTESSETTNTIVVLKFKTQADKGPETVSELTNLIEKVKQEPYFVNIKLHIDPNDNTNILLYEEWEDISYYNSEHMNTDHLKEFQANSTNFLTGPPEISIWKVERVFSKD
jgi:quinol monooxygenase YgiN